MVKITIKKTHNTPMGALCAIALCQSCEAIVIISYKNNYCAH